MIIEHPLEKTAAECRQIAAQWVGELTSEDQRYMVRAFHRAESLAHHALSDAIEQLPQNFQIELLEQLADETHLINIFANWHNNEPNVIRIPKNKQRGAHMWFALLLINEITGFCQFQMLYGLQKNPQKAEDVADIIADEIRHIQRLVRWLEPFEETPSKTEIQRIIAAFRSKLVQRMTQFLPREELSGLRTQMAAAIDTLLGQLTGAFEPTT